MKIEACFAAKAPEVTDKVQRLKITLLGGDEIEIVDAGKGSVQIRTNETAHGLRIEPHASNVIVLRSRLHE